MKTMTVKGQKFYDREGREIILHGVNMVCKDKNRGYIGAYDRRAFSQLKQWGFNVVRLGIIWDGLEPEPGVYDEAYLDKVSAIIEYAGEVGIAVFLDMHQDLFSVNYADGAPEWATLIEDAEHVETGLWSESYLLSPAVHKAFDNFWANKPVSDGRGVMDHYISAWAHVAKRFAEYDHVIGYDLMNEPFMGSGVDQVLGAIMMALNEGLFPGQAPDFDKLQAIWMDPSNKEQLMTVLSDKELYESLVRSGESVSGAFEQSVLTPFYEALTKAIRKEDPTGLVFLEANYFSNMGMASGVEPVKTESGEIDPYQVYSPHGYDLLVDTDMYHISSNNRIDTIFHTHKAVADKNNMPVVIGEWGCYPEASELQLDQAAYIVGIFETFLAGETYFDYEQLDGNRIMEVINRAYPMAVAGSLKKYHYDYKTQEFDCHWIEGDGSAMTRIYLPDQAMVEHICVEPKNSAYTIEMIQGSKGLYVDIPSLSAGSERRLSVK